MAQVRKRQRLVRLYDDSARNSPLAEIEAAEAEEATEGGALQQQLPVPASVSQQLPENVEDVDDDDFGDVPDDTLAAVLLLNSQFPRLKQKDVPLVALRSQIYSVVRDRTIVDRQLDDLRLQNKLRMFKLLSLQDEYAYLLSADYLAIISRLLAAEQAKGTSADTLQVLRWFPERVLPRCTDINISHASLMAHLAANDRGAKTHDRVTDAHVSLLLNLGLLSRHSHTADQYLFAIPNAGPVIKGIIGGRKELIGMLKRRRYPEMFAKELHKKRLVHSQLGMRFHVRDLVGLGTLAQSQTTSGLLLRVVKKF